MTSTNARVRAGRKQWQGKTARIAIGRCVSHQIAGQSMLFNSTPKMREALERFIEALWMDGHIKGLTCIPRCSAPRDVSK
ncbi:MAG: hypothetical protein AAFV53_18365 [Myxococcota bacterium]